ncbi:aldehyde dehydrogenase [Acrocarpospora corrugata]|uniref:Aldehyde dehydrogenase n=1 Tax=Acrocarpospora corrugata TaxID=35763 RepID=A0A5M3WEK3_9ACTN|nr:aldehyde dehydrogenase [Acrocarpospora corrugata]
MFIGGRWVTGTESRPIEVRNPATGARVGRAVLASRADVDDAVAAARESFAAGGWSGATPAHRAQVLRTAADLLEKRAAELARLITAELGCPIWLSERTHVPEPISRLRQCADLAESFEYEVRGDHSLVTREPVGVVGAITPWNGPLSMPTLTVAPALAAGCSVVLKPAPETPLTAYHLAEALMEAGLPDGVLSVLPGDRDAGTHLVEHPEVDQVAFTGGSAAGRRVLTACADRIARVTLELGGRSAAVILGDADLDHVVSGLLPQALLVNGQTGITQTRLLAPRPLAARLAEAVAEGLRAQRLGDPMDSGTTVGPMVSRRWRDRVEAYLALAREEGAQVVAEQLPAALPHGWFVAPTLLTGVDSTMRVAREEIFGPVLAIIPYDREEEAVAITNDAPAGLSGSVWSADEERALGIARRIRTGTISLNGRTQAAGELGPDALRGYLVMKSIAL